MYIYIYISMWVFNQVNWVTSATMVCSVGSPQDHRTRLSLKYNPKRKHPSPMISLNQNNIPEFQNLFIEIQNYSVFSMLSFPWWLPSKKKPPLAAPPIFRAPPLCRHCWRCARTRRSDQGVRLPWAPSVFWGQPLHPKEPLETEETTMTHRV